jgi:hypothetical protein
MITKFTHDGDFYRDCRLGNTYGEVFGSEKINIFLFFDVL